MYKIKIEGVLIKPTFDTLEDVLAWVDVLRPKTSYEKSIVVYYKNQVLEVF